MISKNLVRGLFGVAVVAILAVRVAWAAEEHVVEFRLASWRTEHVHDAQKGAEHEKLLKKLGCEVKTNAHGNHIDMSYRCPQWRKLAAESDDSAHRWQAWLKNRGFETKHAH